MPKKAIARSNRPEAAAARKADSTSTTSETAPASASSQAPPTSNADSTSVSQNTLASRNAETTSVSSNADSTSTYSIAAPTHTRASRKAAPSSRNASTSAGRKAPSPREPTSSGSGPPSDIKATQADLGRREITYDMYPEESTEVDDYLKAFLDKAGGTLNEADLFPIFAMTHDDEKDFRIKSFQKSAEMIKNAWDRPESPFTRVKNKDKIIYSFKDPRLSQKGFFVGIVQDCGVDRELRPDLAVALLQKVDTSGKPKTKAQTTAKLSAPASTQDDALKKEESGKEVFDQEDDSDFKAVYFLSVLECKMADGSLSNKFTTAVGKSVRNPNFEKKYSFVNQELAYVIRRVLPDLARCGISRERIPFFVIAGKISKVSPSKQLCSLEGELIVADRCSEHIHYTITNFETFADSSPDKEPQATSLVQPGLGTKTAVEKVASAGANSYPNVTKTAPGKSFPHQTSIRPTGTNTGADETKEWDPAVKKMATAFCRFIYFGFASALEAMENFASADKSKSRTVCKPMSGRKLIIHGRKSKQGAVTMDPQFARQSLSLKSVEAAMKNLSLVDSEDVVSEDVVLYPGTLDLLAVPSRGDSAASLRVSQADLFEGTISHDVLDVLRSPRRKDIESLWFCESEEKISHEVLVKVSSCAVHPQLAGRGQVWSALKTAHSNKILKTRLSNVLVAVFKLTTGFVTIMHDLRKKGYGALCLDKNNLKSSWWRAVITLVETELYPLAILKIVHFDIRPGYDVTSNILAGFDNKEIHLLLIDYESLVGFDDLSTVKDTDGRFVPKDCASDAIGFLWWQCLLLAYVWHHEKDQSSLQRKENGLPEVVSILREGAKHWQALEYEKENFEIDDQGQNIVRYDFESWLYSNDNIRYHLCNRTALMEVEELGLLLVMVVEYFEGRAIRVLDGK